MTRVRSFLLGVLALGMPAAAEAQIALPPRWTSAVVVSGASNPVSFAFLPDGRMVVAELGGALRLVAGGQLLSQPMRVLPVTTGSERGLLGLAVDPDFSSNGFLYVYYTSTASPPKNRVSRLTMSGNGLLPGETILLDGIASDAGNHNAGDLGFGPDGLLYIATGDGGARPDNSQNLANLSGKILRVTRDGTPAAGNPFAGVAGARPEIWHYGLRNPFRFSFDPGGRLFIGDVGSSRFEEVNMAEPGVSGLNFGWPHAEGPSADPRFTSPLHSYARPAGGAAITGGVTSGAGVYPPEFGGAYFFADFVAGFIDVLRHDPATRSTSVVRLASGAPGIVKLVRGPDGRVYYCSLFSGEIRRLEYDFSGGLALTAAATPAAVEPGEATLLAAHVSVAGGAPATGVVVTADLSALGGAPAQRLYDDGTSGDAAAGDQVFSFRAVAGAATPLGAVDVPLAAADAQGRIATATVTITIQAVRDADLDGLPDRCETAAGLDPASAAPHQAASGDFDEDGRTNLEECQGGTHPRGFFVRRFAEGASGDFFRAWFAVTNPHPSATAHVWFRFHPAAGAPITEAIAVPPGSRRTLSAASVPGLRVAEFATEVESDVEVAVERTMSWDRRGYGAHAQSGLVEAATTWFLAEGATHSGFELFYLLQNPGTADAQVEVAFLRPGGLPPLVKTYAVRGESRRTVWVNREDPGLSATDVSARIVADRPIVVERAMYRSRGTEFWAAGHGGAGVTATSERWFFAEGATGAFFDTFLLLANPGAAAANVNVTYLLGDGTTFTKPYTVRGQSRLTIWLDTEDPRLASAAVSSLVTVTNGIGIVAERAMWWPGGPATWTESHVSPGATESGRRWVVGEGEIGNGRGAETYLLIANTSGRPGTARVELLVEESAAPPGPGDRTTRVIDLPPSSRTNVPVAVTFLPGSPGARFGATVESVGDQPVDLVVERSTYWDAGGEMWAAGTNALADAGAPASATIVVYPDRIEPDTVALAVGERIRVVNGTGEDVWLASDPHPGHSLCRAMDPVGRLGPGQSAVSGPFRLSGTCTVHEHLRFLPQHHATVTVR
jgi:glucose/arabinose dehydrogenase